jgi:hypothetical protein
MRGDEPSMPLQDRVRSHEEHRPAITTERPRQPAQHGPVGGFEPRARDLTMKHSELMTQHEDLEILGTSPTAAQDEQVDHESDKTVETGHTTILLDPI